MSHELVRRLGVAGVTLAAVVGVPQAAQRALCVELIAETALSVGRVCVTERADSLFVRFESSDTWRLVETQLAVAASLEGVPRGGAGHPILGRFPYKGLHGRGVSAFVYGIANASAPRGPTGSLVIAARAEVARGEQSEGAWAKGLSFTDAGPPATYFIYQRSGSVPPRP
jgi:hypothetical protein